VEFDVIIVLQLFTFYLPFLSDYSVAVAFCIEFGFDWAVASFFSTFSLSLKTDTNLLIYNLMDLVLGFGFATASFHFPHPIELLYCFVLLYQILFQSYCYQHLLHIFLSLKTDTVRKVAGLICRWIFALLPSSFGFSLSSCLFAILFPCIRTSRDSAVANIIFFRSLSRGTDTVPQDRYQIVVRFFHTFTSVLFAGFFLSGLSGFQLTFQIQVLF
jgi:hypothetical protein